MVQASGANQSSHYALVRALDSGTAQIDPWAFETFDKAWFEDHYYSVKAPGMAAVTVPWFAATDAVGLVGRARSAGERVARDEGIERQTPRREALLEQAPVIWMLTLWAVIPAALALLLLVRWVAERFAPGYGTPTAVVLGLGTLVLPYSTMYYAHVPGAALAFGSFALLLRERDGPPRTGLIAVAGLLAGLAAIVEYPAGLIALVLMFFAARGSLRRAAVYAGGVAAGLVPLALYNLWAFGSITHMSYDDVVAVEGASGHDVIGLNDEGLFGVGVPDPGAAWDLLLSPKGLLVITPVVAAAVWGLFLLPRAVGRALGAIVAIAFLYNAGYYLPFGGDVAGPRFLITMLPFAAIGLAVALRERPGPVLGLAAASAVGMIAATLSQPQLAGDDTGEWVDLLTEGDLVFTLFGATGVGNGWLGALPFLLLVAAAIGLARWPRARSGSVPFVALGVWAVVALVVGNAPALTLAGALAGVLAVLGAQRRGRQLLH